MSTTNIAADAAKIVHATSHPVLRVNSKRLEQSPYVDKWVTDDTVFAIYAKRLYPVSLGEDVLAHYWNCAAGLCSTMFRKNQST